MKDRTRIWRKREKADLNEVKVALWMSLKVQVSEVQGYTGPTGNADGPVTIGPVVVALGIAGGYDLSRHSGKDSTAAWSEK